MTELTRMFIPVTSDRANAKSFAEAVETGSDEAARNARQGACRHVFGGSDSRDVHSDRLWQAMRKDMRGIIDEARAARGYCDMADLIRAGYCEHAVAAYLKAQATHATGDAT